MGKRITLAQMRELTREDRVRHFVADLRKLDELLAVVHKRALTGDTAAGHLEVKVLERRARLMGLDAPRQLDMTLEVRQRKSTAEALENAFKALAEQGKLSDATIECARANGMLPAPDPASDPPEIEGTVVGTDQQSGE